MATEKASVVFETKAAKDVSFKGFQSKEAMEAAEKSSRPAEDDEEPRAAMTGSASGEIVAAEVNQKMVKVRPRQTISRTRIGNNWYTFTANKETLVTENVKRHLEEKGVL